MTDSYNRESTHPGIGAQPVPGFNQADLGSLRRVTPISRDWGFDRGCPIDRRYIEAFLTRQAADVKGRVLEIGDASYTRRFGDERVTRSDVLHIHAENPNVTIVGDLASAENIPSDTFDCFILTQTLQLIYDVREAVSTVFRILKPGGVVLATVPGISQTYDAEWASSWYWTFTKLSVQRIFCEHFPANHVHIEAQGNVLAAIAFLHGLAAEEFKPEELSYYEPGYEVTIAVRAMKPSY